MIPMTANEISLAIECALLCVALGGGVALWCWALFSIRDAANRSERRTCNK